MRLVDVNLLVYAFREDTPRHSEYRQWLWEATQADEPLGIADVVFSGFLRVVTHPRVFNPPTPLEEALRFVEAVRQRPGYLRVVPGPRHWEIFTGLCRSVAARGNTIPDAFLAGLAIEAGGEWITTDRGFGTFPGLRWRHPLS